LDVSDIFIMSENSLPEYQGHMGKLNSFLLVRQGFLLHLATVQSALRVSKAFRERWGTQWVRVWLKRIKDECGMMLALFFVLTIMNLLLFPDNFWTAEVIAVFVPGMMSTLQLMVDNLRPDARTYCDPTTFAGLSVKRKKLDDGGYAWQFFNHYGFPVGHGNGQNIRQALHNQATVAAVPVACVPQNADIRYMYANEREPLSSEGNLMLWDYR
jgi:hypothetical protein